ncbi:MAG: PilW family protein [Brachymonas sp.]|nr:PilW family protein [Brachymonas sp.]
MKKTSFLRLDQIPGVARQRGLTLVELLVAMAVGLLVVLAALAALLVARTGFSNVDAASQLRDNGRFVALLVDRLAVQSGFRNVQQAAGKQEKPHEDVPPAITGFSNARPRLDDLSLSTALKPGDAGYGSDVLIMRFQAAALDRSPRPPRPPSGPSSSSPDGSDKQPSDRTMIDCFGYAPDVTAKETEPYVSVLSVGKDATGEPALMCSRSDTGLAPYSSSSLVRGVELFKVLYGVDSGVSPRTVPDAAAKLDTVPKRYLTAQEMVVSGDEEATRENWRRVRSLRIGMVLRSDVTPGAREALTLHPFGAARAGENQPEGSAFVSAENINSEFKAPADGRIRQVVTFTVHLRNDQRGGLK